MTSTVHPDREADRVARDSLRNAAQRDRTSEDLTQTGCFRSDTEGSASGADKRRVTEVDRTSLWRVSTEPRTEAAETAGVAGRRPIHGVRRRCNGRLAQASHQLSEVVVAPGLYILIFSTWIGPVTRAVPGQQGHKLPDRSSNPDKN